MGLPIARVALSGADFGAIKVLSVVLGAGCLILGALPARMSGNLALLCVTVIGTLVAAELVLQIVFPGYLGMIYRLDPVFLHALIPNSRHLFIRAPENGGERLLTSVNGRGFIGPEFEIRPEQKRIIVYGDSFIAAEFSDYENSFVAKLGDALSAYDRNILAINAGVAGYGPDQAIGRSLAEADALRPALLVLSVYVGNDFGDLLRNRMFKLNSKGELVSNRFEFTPQIAEDLRMAARLPILARLVIRAYGRITRVDYFGDATVQPIGPNEERTVSLERCHQEYEDYVVRGSPLVTSPFGDYFDADVAFEPESESASYKVSLLQALLRHWKAELDRRKIAGMLLVIPYVKDLCPECRFGADVPGYDRLRTTNVVQGLGEGLAIPTLNLAPVFADRAGELYFRGGDNHWNDQGQALAAKEVARFIAERGLMAAAVTPP